jgi:hypothetical protein
VRVTEVYPFSEMQKAETGVLNYEKKVDIIVEKLGCFENLATQFIENDKNRTMINNYNARVVVDEEMGDSDEG